MSPHDEEAESSGAVTQLLRAWRSGNDGALRELMPLVYADLRRIARRELAARNRNSLQPTAVVHELYLRLARQSGTAWESRAHFFAVAATAIRQILVDHARRRDAAKRGGGEVFVSLHEDVAMPGQPDLDVLAVDAALARLAVEHPQQSRIVELRFFGGLSNEEIAEVLETSLPTVKRKWRFARAWLFRELGGAGALHGEP